MATRPRAQPARSRYFAGMRALAAVKPGRKLLEEVGASVLLELGARGKTAFEEILQPFCDRLDFDEATTLARRFFPLGRQVPVVVDPRHALGRPVVEGTNVTTEAIMSLVRGGETVEDIAGSLAISLEAVKAAKAFELSQSARPARALHNVG